VVDDDRDFTDALALLLLKWGHAVRVAHSGAEALRIAATWQPAIVLLDLAMPGMDGLQLARQLRAAPATADAVLIAMTGCTSEAVRCRAGELGVTSYVLKPADPASLRQLLTARPQARGQFQESAQQ
jgi:CheY-like chemotaxis protein